MKIDLSKWPLGRPYYAAWIKSHHQSEDGSTYLATRFLCDEFSTREEAEEALDKIPDDGNERGVCRAACL